MPKTSRANVDPKVSCPIVCGEYMRATGFFFEKKGTTFLVTSRHNVLPTDITVEHPQTGDCVMDAASQEFLPEIDIYLRDGSGWERTKVDARGESESFASSEIDILAVELDVDPGRYGYRIWREEDITEPEDETSELTSIGFDDHSFPSANEDYSVDHYCNAISSPRLLEYVNPLSSVSNSDVTLPVGVGIDTTTTGSYRGLSGSPVLGNGLVGVHTMNIPYSKRKATTIGAEEASGIGYFRASMLSEVFSAPMESSITP